MINGDTKITDLNDDDENQNELEHKAHEHGSIDKDFYDKLPEWFAYTLDNLDKRFYGKSWFEEAWQKYRDHVMNSETKDIRAPGYVFNEYIKKDHELDPAEVRYGLEGDYYVYPELRSAKEREQDLKDVCYSEEDINSLKHFDEKEHPRGKNGQFVEKGWTKADEERSETLRKQNTLMIAEAKNKELKEAPLKSQMEVLQKSQENLEKNVRSSQDIARGAKQIADDVNKLIPDNTGKTVRGTYPDLSDQELQKRINRINLEQKYSDLKGDTKYIESGKDKTKKAINGVAIILDTAVVGLGIAASALIIKNRKLDNQLKLAQLNKIKK